MVDTPHHHISKKSIQMKLWSGVRERFGFFMANFHDILDFAVLCLILSIPDIDIFF
jgi:hypothetical protein